MARYRASLETSRSADEVFAYLSDFATTQEWDPGVAEATRIDDGPVREGSEVRLLASFLGRTVPLTYRVVEFDPPRSVTMLGENATVASRDRITVEPTPEGAVITYDADLALKGLLRVADPWLAIAFRRVGNRALAGLRSTLSRADIPTLVGPRR